MQETILRPRVGYAIISSLPLNIIGVGLFYLSGILLPYGKFIFPLGIFFVVLSMYQILLVYSKSYKITNEQIHYKRGVFSIKVDYLELYRVKDFSIERPFLLRFFGAMNIILHTSDRTHEVFEIKGVRNSYVTDDIRRLVETNRRARGVREFD